MPASKTKYVKTPKHRESVISDLIRRASGSQFGPDWANHAPQGKTTKMRDWASKKKQKFAQGGPVTKSGRKK